MIKEFKNYATSELLFRATAKHADNEGILKFLSELNTRLTEMGLSDEQVSRFWKFENEILKKENHRLQFDKFLFSNPMIKDGVSMDDFNFDDMTFSELVYLSQEADKIYQSGKHGSLKPETVKVIIENKSAIMRESAAMNECIKRLKEMEFSDEQINNLIQNEKAIIQRVHDEKEKDDEQR